MRFVGNDAWEAELPLTGHGLYAFSIEAWPDSFRTWVHELKRKVDVGRDVSSELLEGAALLEAAATRAEAAGVRADAERLRQGQKAFLGGESPATLSAALDPGLVAAASRHPDRVIATRLDRELRIFAERSTNVTCNAPRDRASMPTAPEPAQRSRKRTSIIRAPRKSKRASRRRRAVGFTFGDAEL